MPIISRFSGIVIRMYFQQAEHNPPHIHALYGKDMAEINIRTGEVMEGMLPLKALTLVRKRTELHRDELNEMWETQEFRVLEPLE